MDGWRATTDGERMDSRKAAVICGVYAMAQAHARGSLSELRCAPRVLTGERGVCESEGCATVGEEG